MRLSVVCVIYNSTLSNDDSVKHITANILYTVSHPRGRGYKGYQEVCQECRWTEIFVLLISGTLAFLSSFELFLLFFFFYKFKNRLKV